MYINQMKEVNEKIEKSNIIIQPDTDPLGLSLPRPQFVVGPSVPPPDGMVGGSSKNRLNYNKYKIYTIKEIYRLKEINNDHLKDILLKNTFEYQYEIKELNELNDNNKNELNELLEEIDNNKNMLYELQEQNKSLEEDLQQLNNLL